MTIYEDNLPGVGKKYEIELDGERRLLIVIHNTGRRELFVRDEPDADAEKLFELTDQLARQVGTIMEGAYFQPIQTETIETVLSDNTLIEWVTVTDASPLVGETLAETRLRQELGVSVIAVQRGDEVITNPDPDIPIETDDTLVVLGSQDACQRLNEVVAGNTGDETDTDSPIEN